MPQWAHTSNNVSDAGQQSDKSGRVGLCPVMRKLFSFGGILFSEIRVAVIEAAGTKKRQTELKTLLRRPRGPRIRYCAGRRCRPSEGRTGFQKGSALSAETGRKRPSRRRGTRLLLEVLLKCFGNTRTGPRDTSISTAGHHAAFSLGSLALRGRPFPDEVSLQLVCGRRCLRRRTELCGSRLARLHARSESHQPRCGSQKASFRQGAGRGVSDRASRPRCAAQFGRLCFI
jgi:hypothetical protein